MSDEKVRIFYTYGNSDGASGRFFQKILSSSARELKKTFQHSVRQPMQTVGKLLECDAVPRCAWILQYDSHKYWFWPCQKKLQRREVVLPGIRKDDLNAIKNINKQ